MLFFKNAKKVFPKAERILGGGNHFLRFRKL